MALVSFGINIELSIVRSHVWAKSSGLILIPGLDAGNGIMSYPPGTHRERATPWPHRWRIMPGYPSRVARGTITVPREHGHPSPSDPARARSGISPPVPLDPRHSIRKLLTLARCPLKNEHARVSVIEMQSDPSSPTIRERANRTLQFFPHRGSTGCRTVNECVYELSSRLTLTNIVNPIRVPCDIVLAPCNLLCRKIAPRDFID